MSAFLREHSWPIVLSVALHGLLAAALVAATLISLKSTVPKLQPIPVDAVVVDSQVLHAAQRALADRADQEVARARAAAQAKAAAEAAAAQAVTDAQKAVEQQHAAEQASAAAAAEAERSRQAEVVRTTEAQKVAAAKRAEELKRAEDAKRTEDARHAEQVKRAADAKQAEDAKRTEDAKHAADLKAKAEREAELRRQLAEEEHVSAVEASPARAQYIARLAARIQNAWIKPPSARAGLDCVVNITQIPGGEVTSAHVSQCNGDAAARASIENAVYRASPLPAPPDAALFERNLLIHFHPDE